MINMDIDSYFNKIQEEFNTAYAVASEARSKGYDPKPYVEIRPAPDLASRVEGLINIEGLADIIRAVEKGQSRNKLAFDVAKEICANERFSNYEELKRIELAVRVGVAVLTEGILVAPTEGISSFAKYKNRDGTDYLCVCYAGPIRGAGGTSAALSVALADHCRKIFNISDYKPTEDEIERYMEEIELYHDRIARLQYKPPEQDIREILRNCPVCIDGMPPGILEVGVHANMKRTMSNGKEVPITNKVRGGVPLVVCEGIAQKAKKMLKETKSVGLNWDWLNNIIKVDVKKTEAKDSKAVFLEEIVAGRPILAYPGMTGGFRLRYGRSRFTGIAAKGVSPATMIILKSFIATGTQMKVEFPGKGCVAAPVDSIEGPFVTLKDGSALRIDDAETAERLKDQIKEIINVGDILVTYGDFKKSNTQLKTPSYTEELWGLELKEKQPDLNADHKTITFEEAKSISAKHSIPIHPKFLFEFQSISAQELDYLREYIRNNKAEDSEAKKKIRLDSKAKRILELLNVSHTISSEHIITEKELWDALLASINPDKEGSANPETDTLEYVNSLSEFKIPRRSTFVGARIGRPEKAKERLMKPAPNILFPLGSYGGRDRNISSAYSNDMKKFKHQMSVEIARYRCSNCKRIIDTPYCYDCSRHAYVEKICPICSSAVDDICPRCEVHGVGYYQREIDLTKLVTNAMTKLGISSMPKVLKGVKGMVNANKYTEPMEKGILRAFHNIYIFKDGTSRFDATDMPITHFYPIEIGISVERARELGYTKDYLGNELTEETQLVDMMHQDVILNRRGADYLLKTARFVDELLERFYGLKPFYNATTINDLVGKLVITLSPHTSCGVTNRIIGFTDANVGFAHPYVICARRRNCDGDEDSTMLLLDALINFSREYHPSSTGGTMDIPIILTVNVKPEEVDDEVHAMECVAGYPLEFYRKAYERVSPSEAKLEIVESRLGSKSIYSNIMFTNHTSYNAVNVSPKRSSYTQFKTMGEKLDAEFNLMDMIHAVDKKNAARKVITGHFIPDLIGNLHSFSRQIFRCSSCNSKYRRIPLSGKCTKDGGKLLLTISKGGIEKYLQMAINLADKYDLDDYIKQRLYLTKEEINSIFASEEPVKEGTEGQFNLLSYV